MDVDGCSPPGGARLEQAAMDDVITGLIIPNTGTGRDGGHYLNFQSG